MEEETLFNGWVWEDQELRQIVFHLLYKNTPDEQVSVWWNEDYSEDGVHDHRQHWTRSKFYATVEDFKADNFVTVDTFWPPEYPPNAWS